MTNSLRSLARILVFLKARSLRSLTYDLLVWQTRGPTAPHLHRDRNFVGIRFIRHNTAGFETRCAGMGVAIEHIEAARVPLLVLHGAAAQIAEGHH